MASRASALRECIAGWTAPPCDGVTYPEYVSINRIGDDVEITVRSAQIMGKWPHDFPVPGAVAVVRMSVDEFRALLKEAQEHLP